MRTPWYSHLSITLIPGENCSGSFKDDNEVLELWTKHPDLFKLRPCRSLKLLSFVNQVYYEGYFRFVDRHYFDLKKKEFSYSFNSDSNPFVVLYEIKRHLKKEKGGIKPLNFSPGSFSVSQKERDLKFFLKFPFTPLCQLS